MLKCETCPPGVGSGRRARADAIDSYIYIVCANNRAGLFWPTDQEVAVGIPIRRESQARFAAVTFRDPRVPTRPAGHTVHSR